MSRPLLICDCDEVLLHMVSHFRDWLGEAHDVDFRLEGNDFAHAMRRRDTGEALPEKEIWELLGGFFDTQMHRQDPIPGAMEALAEIAQHADIVILTNLIDRRREARAEQLRRFGLDVQVYTNQGPKGPAIAAIVEEHRPSLTIFVDDLAQHHMSAAQTVPDVLRLHLCGEPDLAPHIACGKVAGHAHARIDTWEEALPWIMERIEENA